MKNILKILGIIVLFMIIGFLMISCGGGEGDGGTDQNNLTPITSVSITVTSPAKDGIPDTTATGTGNFTIGAVAWSPNNNPFLGGTGYKASVTLTADTGYTFTGLGSATINGYNATISNNNGSSLTIAYTFAATLTKTVTSISVSTQPSNLIYTHGGTLDLAGLKVTISYNEGVPDVADLNDFGTYSLSALPANGTTLSRATHNNQPVVVSLGTMTANTGNLTVNQANPTVIWPTGLIAVIGQTLSNIALPGNGTGTPSGTFTWTIPSNPVGSVGTQSHNMTFTPTDNNYKILTQNVNITVNEVIPIRGDVVISQIYGAGGSSGATYNRDYVVLHNRLPVPVNLSGWSLQYGSANNSNWASIGVLSGTIIEGGYYLIAPSKVEINGANLPIPNTEFSFDISSAAGRLILSNKATAYPNDTIPDKTDTSIIDFVSYGTTLMILPEWGGTTPTPNNTTAVIRKNNGCYYTGSISADFEIGTPAPMNSSSPTHSTHHP